MSNLDLPGNEVDTFEEIDNIEEIEEIDTKKEIDTIEDIDNTARPLNYCYILYNDQNNLTYNGFTNNLQRRIRQHNGEIKGGAKYTTRRRLGWKYLAYVTVHDPAFTKRRALSCEWSIKYPTGHRPRGKEFNSPEGRLRGLQLAMQNPKFSDLTFITYICPKYAHLVEGSLLIG